MKVKLLDPIEIKAFAIGLGLSVFFLALSILISSYQSIREKETDFRKTPTLSTHDEPRHKEVRGMN